MMPSELGVDNRQIMIGRQAVTPGVFAFSHVPPG